MPWQRPGAELDTLEAAEAAAPRSLRWLNAAEVVAEFDARSDKHHLRISRRHHGNVKSSVITADFVHGADYEALSTAGQTFRAWSARRHVARAAKAKQKDAKVGDSPCHEVADARPNAVGRQRYKRAWAR